jgi:sugar-specific transcriptional regulator TrmB
MDQNTIVQKLREFGLLENEARVYLGLVLKGPMRPSEISEVSGVARAEVHRHLRSLGKKGFSLVVAGNGKQYCATPPDEALGSLVERVKIERDKMIKKKEELTAVWAQEQGNLGSSKEESESFQFLKDAQIGIERGTRLLINATKVARVLLHLAIFEAYFSDGLLRSSEFLRILKSVKDKPEAEVRILVVSYSEETGNLMDVLRNVKSTLDLKVRVIESPLLEALPDAVVIDDKELLIRATSTKTRETGKNIGGEARAIVTNISTVVNPFVILFDQNWDNAIDCYPENRARSMEAAHVRNRRADQGDSEMFENT